MASPSAAPALEADMVPVVSGIGYIGIGYSGESVRVVEARLTGAAMSASGKTTEAAVAPVRGLPPPGSGAVVGASGDISGLLCLTASGLAAFGALGAWRRERVAR